MRSRNKNTIETFDKLYSSKNYGQMDERKTEGSDLIVEVLLFLTDTTNKPYITPELFIYLLTFYFFSLLERELDFELYNRLSDSSLVSGTPQDTYTNIFMPKIYLNILYRLDSILKRWISMNINYGKLNDIFNK